MKGFLKMITILFSMLLSFPFCYPCIGEEISPWDEDLAFVYDELGILDGESWNDLLRKLDLVIEERCKGTAMVENELYILAESGIYCISTGGECALFPFGNLEKDCSLRNIFANGSELWGFSYNYRLALDRFEEEIEQEPCELNYAYGKIDLTDGVAVYTPTVLLDTGIYQGSYMGFGIRNGIQSYPCAINGKLYCKDKIGTQIDFYVPSYMGSSGTEKKDVHSLISFDLGTGEGKELFSIPSVYDCTAYGYDRVLVLPNNLGEFFPQVMNFMKPTARNMMPLVSINLFTGKATILYEFGQQRYDTWRYPYGNVAGLAYDSKTGLLFYTNYGKLYSLNLDNREKTIIADAPSSWLHITTRTKLGFLTGNGYYFSIADMGSKVGVEIIPVNE